MIDAMITGPTSYPPTIEAFLDHWEPVNVALGAAGPLVLRKNATETLADVPIAGLNTMLTNLNAQRGAVNVQLNEIETARADIELKKAALLIRLNQFNTAVRSELANTKYPAGLSNVPSISDGVESWRDVCDDVVSLWAKIDYDDAMGPAMDLKLLGAYTLELFTIEQDNLRAAFRAARKAERNAITERAERDRQQDVIYKVLKAYRAAVPVKLGADAPLTQSMPRLLPAEGSRTPDPVTAAAEYAPATQQAKVTFSASDDEDLKEYLVMGCLGPNFHIADEEILAHIGPAQAREFLTNYGLGLPGQICGYRVVVVLNSGHQNGSEPVYVTRPA